MFHSDLMSMTVLQLRKLARENKIVLGAGLDKASIVNKIADALGIRPQEEQLRFDGFEAAAPVADAGPVEDAGFTPAEKEPVSPAADDAAPVDGGASRTKEEAAPVLKEAEPAPAPAEEKKETVRSEKPVAESPAKPASQEAAPAEPRFQAAWHSPDSPNSANHPAHPAGSFAGARPSWQNPVPTRSFAPDVRSQPLHGAAPQPHRFGPGPASRREEAAPSDAPVPETHGFRPAVSPLPEHRVGFAGNGSFGPKPSVLFTPPTATVPASDDVPANPVTLPEASDAPAPAPAGSPSPAALDSSASPTLEELLSSGDFEEGGGVLELHPDGYGFLRSSNFLPSSRDIYVSMAQIRRFGLRTGDLIQGKIRPQREGDKYAALLYIDTINGVPEAEAFSRPVFDELTPVYPTRRISLEFNDGNSIPAMRLIDLIAPLGFGQRGLILCPPETGKRELLRDYARVVTQNFPDVTILMLLIDLNPEDVTEFRESVPCQVMASTFDQSPEAHLRLTEMVMERAMRLVERQKDVVLLVDSLTRLAKIYTTAAVQQGRSVPGMVNPSSLLRAKKLFGAARACKEGGSLTVIATMDIQTGSRVDDSVVEEFKGTANMELMLDQNVARAGVSPAVNLQRSFTKNADLLLNPRQKEGLSLIREMLGSTSSAVAIPQLLSMMEKTATNSDLLLKMKDWFALMNR